METVMTCKIKPTDDDDVQLEAPITLTLGQVEEAAGGAAVTGAALLVKFPTTTIGLINPDILEM
jgi:hypothetical protein